MGESMTLPVSYPSDPLPPRCGGGGALTLRGLEKNRGIFPLEEGKIIGLTFKKKYSSPTYVILMSSYPQEVRDPIYGFINFFEWEEKIINHPYFQRLRRISQNGLEEMVYPSLTHSRFEHSLGVMHLASEMFDSIMKDDENIERLEERGYLPRDREGITNRIRQIIRLTALLHDVGQPPFSHPLEGKELMQTNPKGELYTHEDYTAEIIENGFNGTLNRRGLEGIDSKLLRDFYEGSPVETIRGIGFWRRLITGQLDADRGDYLLRDSRHTGVKYGVYDLKRVLETLGVGIHPEDKTPRLGIKEEGWQVAEAFVIARYKMFTQVYLHKTRRAFDIMLQKAVERTFELNDKVGPKFPPPSEFEEYLEFNDHNLWCLMEDTIEENEGGNEWFRRIKNREHIRCLREFNPKNEENTLKEVKKRLNEENIWFVVDDLEESWYKKEKRTEEIFLIDEEGDLFPLSEKSSIVGKLKPFKKIRLYVKPEQENEAERIKEEVVE